MSQNIRIVLADDETLFGEAITTLLDLAPGITVVPAAICAPKRTFASSKIRTFCGGTTWLR